MTKKERKELKRLSGLCMVDLVELSAVQFKRPFITDPQANATYNDYKHSSIIKLAGKLMRIHDDGWKALSAIEKCHTHLYINNTLDAIKLMREVESGEQTAWMTLTAQTLEDIRDIIQDDFAKCAKEVLESNITNQ